MQLEWLIEDPASYFFWRIAVLRPGQIWIEKLPGLDFEPKRAVFHLEMTFQLLVIQILRVGTKPIMTMPLMNGGE